MMITPRYIHTMARYNAWQNRSIFGAADGLTDEMRKLDRGGFFGSIHRTLCHLLWGDTLWMSRIDDWQASEVGLAESPDLIGEWGVLVEARARADERILDWAEQASAEDIRGDLRWFSLSLGREMSVPWDICITHFFNHQTHHRGQVHAMLTAAGAEPADTDLIFMPEAEP